MLNDWSFVLVMAAMTTAALVTRIAGAVLMSRVTSTAKTERFLEGLAVSVIAALVASQLMAADTRNAAAVAVAIVVTLSTRSAIFAIVAGMMTAAALPLIMAL